MIIIIIIISCGRRRMAVPRACLKTGGIKYRIVDLEGRARARLSVQHPCYINYRLEERKKKNSLREVSNY